MKSKTRLDSVVFHLTPTRTRCDLVITANGKTEKIASGLLDPFLAHLKAAQEQIGKGGYSIILEPKPGNDVAWFTKGTVERFVRFVSTPEILERVYTIESEISQIEKSISVHVNSENEVHIQREDHPAKSEERIEGCKPVSSDSDEKAIVIYQPTNQLQEEDGFAKQEENSKVQLIQVLQTRKTALQKEQGMAFARAIAASFDIDNISNLISFAECFGATRMMDACKRFVDLWKAKHEVGQWLEVETNASVSCRTDMASMNASGIMFVNSNEHGDVALENNGILSSSTRDTNPQANQQGQPNSKEHMPTQFGPPMFPPWQMHPQANGMPVFQPYSPQGMAYYPMTNPYYYQSPHTPLDDSRKHVSQRKTRERRHSIDSTHHESDDDDDDVDMVEDSASTRRSKTSGKKSSRKRVVVIRNLNYIASENQVSSSDGEQDSELDLGIDIEEANSKGEEMRKSKRKEKSPAQVGDDGEKWQTFQNFLLEGDEESGNSVRNNMFELEGKAPHNKRQHDTRDAASVLVGQYLEDKGCVGLGEHEDITERTTRTRKPARQGDLTTVWDSSFDPVIASGSHKGSSNGVLDESSMILRSSGSHDVVVSDNRSPMNINFEHNPSYEAKSENYEANDLNLIPDRVMENGPGIYDPALDYEMQAQVNKGTNVSGKKEDTTQEVKERPMRKGVKEQKLKTEKRISTNSRKEKPNKFSPSEDARARADKLRAFKADLQKQKKEMEEEQKRKIEALRMERQKRIAAKSGGNPVSSSLSSPLGRKKLPKQSPVSQKSSKFSDTEPGSSSPLQRSTLKLTSKIRSDQDKTSKSGRLNFGTPNRLTRSTSSLSSRKEDSNNDTVNGKIRRLSEPKVSTTHRTFLAKKGSESKKISVNANIELKLRGSKGSSVSTQKKFPTVEKRSNTRTSVNRSEASTKNLPPIEVNEDTLVDKTVVTLECGKSSKSVKDASEEKSGVKDKQCTAYKLDTNPNEDDVAVPPPASPIIVKEVNRETVHGHIDTHFNERGPPCTENVLPSISNTNGGNSYQPPYARVSSLEDPCMTKSDYAKAVPIGLDMTGPVTETTSVHLPDDSVSEISSENHTRKESSKGFRQLFKFGKKNSVVNESNIDSSGKATFNGSVDDGGASNAASSEVFTLRNLLIQEESSASVTTTKSSSKSFSLLSPFKSKTKEKKSST